METKPRFTLESRPDPLKHLSIGVLYGGPSAEREVSLESGEAVAQALQAAGRDVHRVVLDGSFNVAMARSLGLDAAFLALHGEFGEDGRVQMILEEADIPYIGSGPDASALAFDKVLAKRALEANGILTPAWLSFDREEWHARGGAELLDLSPPVVVKPAASGSSLGVSLVRRSEQLEAAFHKAFEYDDSVVVERYVAGRELTAPVVGEEPLPVVELRVKAEFFDYFAKYKDDETRALCPAELSPALTARAQATALLAHRALGCRDLSRTDMILDPDGLCWVLEANTLPGMTSHSLLPKSAAAAGMDFTSLCEFLLVRAVQRTRQRAAPTS
jgi:D-alanine-D-alanine ligase